MIRHDFIAFVLLSVFIFIMPYKSNAEGLYGTEFFLRNKEFASFAFASGTIKPLVILPKGILNILEIKIGRDSISGVLSKFGDAYLSREHGASGNYGLCYSSMEQKDNTVLIFESGPSGGWHTIDGFSLVQDYANVLNKCISSPYVSAALKLGAGLRLGMTQDDLSAIMQTPSAIKGEWKGYIYGGKRKIKETEFDVTASVLVRIVNSKVVEIWVSKVEFS